MATNKRSPAINSTTLVDLKAELYKKQQEVKASSKGSYKDHTTQRHVSEKTASIWLAPNKTTKGRRQKPAPPSVEPDPLEEEALTKSRMALEKKAKMYEEMSRGEGLADEELNRHGDLCLVDFERKLYETVDIADERRGNVTPPPPAPADGEWVEYTDHFGRSRMCHRSDLAEMVEKTRKLKEEESGTGPDEVEEDKREGPVESPLVHYQNVQNKEARSHGVGYFGFSEDEQKRQEQLSVLNKLRNQTESQRQRREEMKSRRKAALEARLAKVRQRKLKQNTEGIEGEEDRGGHEDRAGQEETAGQELSLPKEDSEASVSFKDASPSERDVPQKRAVRPWDKGKILPAVKRAVQWKKDLQNERDPEFAPPSNYFNSNPDTPKMFSPIATPTIVQPVPPHPATLMSPSPPLHPTSPDVHFVKPTSTDQFVTSANLGFPRQPSPPQLTSVDTLIAQCRAEARN